MCFSLPPDGIQRISVRFTGVPSWKYRWVASVLLLTGLFQHLFRLVVQSLSFREVRARQGLKWCHRCSDRTLLHSARISYFFHSCNRLYLFPSSLCSQDIAVWKNFRKVRRSRCYSSRRSNPAILCWTCWSSASGSSPEGMNFSIHFLTLFSRVVSCCC